MSYHIADNLSSFTALSLEYLLIFCLAMPLNSACIITGCMVWVSVWLCQVATSYKFVRGYTVDKRVEKRVFGLVFWHWLFIFVILYQGSMKSVKMNWRGFVLMKHYNKHKI